MKELSLEEIKESTKNFSTSWMNISEGESAQFEILSRTLYNIPAGDEGIDGSTTEFDRWQCKVIDKDGVTRVLKVQKRLAQGMLNLIEEKKLSWEDHFKSSVWKVERIDQYNWKVELIDWKGKDAEGAPDTQSSKKTNSKVGEKDLPTKTKKTDTGKFSEKTQVAYKLIENNELNHKEFTKDALQTVISSLTDLNLDESTAAIGELVEGKVIKIKDDKVVWL